MKPRRYFFRALLALLLSAVCAVTVFSSGSDAVVSLSYLTGTYADALRETLAGTLSSLDEAYQTAEDGTGVPDGWTVSDTFQALYPLTGETVTLSAGSGLLWYSGTGRANRTLVDVTDGATVIPGKELTAGHRYLAQEQTLVVAASASACAAQGVWISTATGEAPLQSPFSDVAEDDWFFDPVMYVVGRELFNGTGEGRFSPEGTMDRSMVVTVLYRLAGSPDAAGDNPFTDVADGAWYTDAILWAVQAKIISGAAGTFEPAQPISREEMALLFYRFASWYGVDVAARADLSLYSDGDEVSPYAVESFQWAVATGVFEGYDGRLFSKNTASRAEVAALFQRLDELIA